MDYYNCLKNLHSKINTPLTYKEICKISRLPYLGGSSKKSLFKELECWCKFEKTKSPTRYIFLEFYENRTENKPVVQKLPEDQYKYEDAERFFIKRKLTHPEPLPYPIRNRQKISYICDFHPDIVQEASWGELRNSIGCPLCKYQSSRFEIMTYLGIKNAQSRAKFNGVEFDVYIPSINTVVEIDGYFYHKDDTPEQLERKQKAAKENNLTFLRIIETLDTSQIGIENNIMYITPYATATKIIKKKIIDNLSCFLPFRYTDALWDDAAEYMRKNKTMPTIILPKTINQFDKDGNLINTYTVNQLIAEISTGSAFGYNWEITE